MNCNTTHYRANSSSVPGDPTGVFPPIEIDRVFYSDGGAVCVTPVRAAKNLGADFIVASDVKSKCMRWDKPEKAKEIMDRCNYITGLLLNDIQLQEADAVIAPAIKYMHWSEFDKVSLMVKEGEKAAILRLRAIKAKLIRRGVFDRIRGLFAKYTAKDAA